MQETLDGAIYSYNGNWYAHFEGLWKAFRWRPGYMDSLEKAPKKYYTPEEVKAMGMRWVTIRGAHVLVQGTSDGGWVVVGGAGGNLNHLHLDKILSKREYKEREEKRRKKKKEEWAELSDGEKEKQIEKREQEQKEREAIREDYEKQVSDVMGMSPDDLESYISDQEMEEVSEKAREMAEHRNKRKKKKTTEKDVEQEKEKLLNRKKKQKLKETEHKAMKTLMNDYMGDDVDPNDKEAVKDLLDEDKAKQVLMAKREMRKRLRKVGKDKADKPTDKYRVGDVYAEYSKSLPQDVIDEVKQNIETQKNIEFYNNLNAQSESVQKHVNVGATEAFNGMLSDIFGGGAVFSHEAVNALGVDGIAKTMSMYINETGDRETVKKALMQFGKNNRERIVEDTLNDFEDYTGRADTLRKVAKGDGGEDQIMSVASANGHALKYLNRAQETIGSSTGSLRAMAHVINALDEKPPQDKVALDMGKNLDTVKRRLARAGLSEDMYNIKQKKEGQTTRMIAEIPRESVVQMFNNNQAKVSHEDHLSDIKNHKNNNGYLPPGMNKDIQLKPVQEAGLRFWKSQKRVLLDFEAGSGKTPLAYAAAMDAMHNHGAKKVLIVTPAKLRNQMKSESKKFLDEDNAKNVHNTEGKSPDKRREIYQREGITIIGHDQLRTDKKALKEAGFDMAIVDEIHDMTTPGKGGSGRYRGMMELKDIPYKIGMSGTNIKNSKEEIYKKVKWLDPDNNLGTRKEFNNKYKGINQNTNVFSQSSMEAFRRELSPYMYSERANLDVKHEMNRVRVPMTKDQRQKYKQSQEKYDAEKGNRGAAARRASRNYNIVSNGDADTNAKAQKIVETMNSNHPGEKAVVHVQQINALNSTVKKLKNEYGQDSVGVIRGSTSGSKSEKIKARFNDPDDPLQFIVGTSSIENGYNFQGGTVNFHMDIPHTYASFDQRNKRTYRSGQDRDVNSYLMVGENPFDMRREDNMMRKKKESELLGNPQTAETNDETGFLSTLKQYEKEAAGGTSEQ